MLFGDNAKKVYEMLCEFIAKRLVIEPKLVPPGRNIDELDEIFTLIEICDRFLFKSGFDKIQLFNVINDAYNVLPDGIVEFIRFRQVLEKEKKLHNYQNLALVVKKRKKD